MNLKPYFSEKAASAGCTIAGDHDLRHDSAVFLLISKNRSVAASISISGLELAQNQGANLKSLADDRFARALRLLKSEENDG